MPFFAANPTPRPLVATERQMETDAIELDLKGTLYDGQLLASPTLMVVTISDKAATVDAVCDTFVSLRPDTTSRGDELYEGMGRSLRRWRARW